ncbi:hypothetical protein JCM3774_005345 [Rhodotorula dairenensis]
MSTFEIPTEQEFDEQFLSLLTGVPAIFPVDPTDDGNLNDVEKVMYAEQRLKDFRLRAKERVDHARDDLRAIARDHKQAELASQRSSAHPTTQAHEAKMMGMRQARLATMKANSELEQQVYRLQGELERLQQELKDEEAEAVDALELDSEILRIKLYRDMGFLPVEQDGKISKVVVRSQNSQDARTIEVDDSVSDYKWSERLWELASR